MTSLCFFDLVKMPLLAFGDAMHFQDTVSAAEAAAESAKKAMAAAEAAAYLAKQDPSQVSEAFGYSNNFNGNPINYQDMDDKSEVPAQMYKSHSVGRSHYSSNEDITPTNMDAKNVNRRHSYNVPPARCDIKFDESDCDEEIDMEEPTDGNNIPPNRPATQVPRIHPKLPDYDALAARFEALKYRKSQT
ncbi:unnamed protein product [Camellia sinensis]